MSYLSERLRSKWVHYCWLPHFYVNGKHMP